MLKFLALILNTVVLLVYQLFFSEGVTITQNIPSSAKAESEFTVELIINKGAASGFAKLQQDLPLGFTAVEENNNGASFSFSNQSVKFIWMSLPGDKEFKISYKVKVAADVDGDKKIGGKFSFVVDNVKQSIEIAPATINIFGGTVPQPVVAATTDTTKTSTEAPKETKTEVTPEATADATKSKAETFPFACIRQVPEKASGEFIVEITVNKGNLSGFAKLLETLPPGFSATAIESQQAAFSFAEQKVKFVWVSLPAIPEFKISYKVSVPAGSSGTQNIDGVFSFIENDETKKFVIPTSSVTIEGAVASEPLVINATKDETKTQTISEAVTTDNSTKTQTADNTKSLSATNIPASQGKVNYRVQIAALHKAKEPVVLASLYKIREQINTEMAEGFTKYTVGTHSEYKSARDAREEIKNKGVVGPFVTAYNIGKRITVQEALMITSQKWYR